MEKEETPIDFNLKLWKLEENSIEAIRETLESDISEKISIIKKLISNYDLNKSELIYKKVNHLMKLSDH